MKKKVFIFLASKVNFVLASKLYQKVRNKACRMGNSPKSLFMLSSIALKAGLQYFRIQSSQAAEHWHKSVHPLSTPPLPLLNFPHSGGFAEEKRGGWEGLSFLCPSLSIKKFYLKRMSEDEFLFITHGNLSEKLYAA